MVVCCDSQMTIHHPIDSLSSFSRIMFQHPNRSTNINSQVLATINREIASQQNVPSLLLSQSNHNHNQLNYHLSLDTLNQVKPESMATSPINNSQTATLVHDNNNGSQQQPIKPEPLPSSPINNRISPNHHILEQNGSSLDPSTTKTQNDNLEMMQQDTMVPSSCSLLESTENTPTTAPILHPYSHFLNPNGSTTSQQPHYISHMYPTTGNSLFGGNNSTPSTLMMTPPSPLAANDGLHSLMAAASETTNSLMSQQSHWYHSATMARNQHHHSAYPHDMLAASDWSNCTANAGSFSSSTNSPLPSYQMSSLQAPYTTQLSYHYPHSGHHRTSSTGLDLCDSRLNNYCNYYSNFLTSTSAQTGQHSLGPLNVGTGVETAPYSTTFGQNSLINSSPDSGVTGSSDSNESPTSLHTSPLVTSRSRNPRVQSNGVDLETDLIKNNPVDLPIAGFEATGFNNSSQQQLNDHETKSQQTPHKTRSNNNSTITSSNNSNVNKQYNWMNKTTSLNSSPSSTGKTRTKDKYRVVYSETQRFELEKEFQFSRYITIKRKSELAVQLSLSERQVKIWFQNRRAKDRKQNRKKGEMMKNEKENINIAATTTTTTTTNNSNVVETNDGTSVASVIDANPSTNGGYSLSINTVGTIGASVSIGSSLNNLSTVTSSNNNSLMANSSNNETINHQTASICQLTGNNSHLNSNDNGLMTDSSMLSSHPQHHHHHHHHQHYLSSSFSTTPSHHHNHHHHLHNSSTNNNPNSNHIGYRDHMLTVVSSMGPSQQVINSNTTPIIS